MNRKPDEIESFDSSNLTLIQPTISDKLSLPPERPAISDNLSIELEQPEIGDDLTQELAHLLMPHNTNSSYETSR